VIAIAIRTQKLCGFGILGEHIGPKDDFAPGRLENQVAFQEEQQTLCVVIHLDCCAPYVLKPCVAFFLY
jgi:hypothetical protein